MIPLILNAVLLSLSFATTWCAPRRSEAERQAARPVDIATLFTHPTQYVGQVVRLEGLFQGFRVTDCRFPATASRAGLTRSDWLFRTGEDCLYVTGGAPPEIDPIDPRYIGRRITLDARVIEGETGKLLLRYVEGRLLGESRQCASRRVFQAQATI
jgi:hypothetical protein